MTVNKITTPPTPQGQIDKINEIIDNTVVDQTYSSSSTNAQSGVALSAAKFLQNTAGNSTSLTVFGNASNSGTGNAINIGYSSTALNSGDIAMGRGSNARGGVSIALGFDATVSNNCSNAIQLGTGTNSTANTFNVGFRNVDNYQLLDGTTGLIPDARLSSNIARTSAIPTVNNATLTITQGGTPKGTFTANAGTDVTIALDAGGGGGGLSYSADCPAITPSSGVATWSVTHSLGTQAVITELYTSSGAKIEHNTLITSNNALTVSFKASSNIAVGDYKIVVLASGADANTSNLADKDLSNVTDTADILMAHNAMPSNTYDTLELGASGTKYTAAADGWVTLGKRASAADQNIGLYLHGENDIELAGVKAISYTSEFMAVTIPVRKNQKFSAYYNAGGSTSYFRFIYAAGAESEAP